MDGVSPKVFVYGAVSLTPGGQPNGLLRLLRCDPNGNLYVNGSVVTSSDATDANSPSGANVPTTVSRLEGFNGATWDRLRVDASKNLKVAVSNPPPSPTNAQITVTNASQQFAAADTTRRYLLIQNNDAAGNIFVRFGAASTLTTGVKIPPGGNYEPLIAPGNSINIIGDIAANANVVLVVG